MLNWIAWNRTVYVPINIIVRVFTNGPGDRVSIPGQVISKTQKMVLDASLLNTQVLRYGSRVKWSNPGKGEVPSSSPRWKGNLRSAFDKGYKLYFICIKRDLASNNLQWLMCHKTKTIIQPTIRFISPYDHPYDLIRMSMFKLLSVDEILLLRYVNWLTNFRGLPFNVGISSSCLKQMRSRKGWCFLVLSPGYVTRIRLGQVYLQKR